MDGFYQSGGFRPEHDDQTFRQRQFACDFHQRRHHAKQRHLADGFARVDNRRNLHVELLVSAKHQRRAADHSFVRLRHCRYRQSGAVNAYAATPSTLNSVAASLTPFPSLWINELQADNLTGITNSAGQHTGWLELYNPSTNVVSLNGLYLANNYTNLLQWAFPSNAVINPGQFKVIFADGETNLSTTNELHTSFVLPSGTGSLALTRLANNGQQQVLDYVDYQNIFPNDSYGSFPDGQSFNRQEFFQATPGAPNNGMATPPPSFVDYAVPGSVYTQNFDSLPDPGSGFGEHRQSR